MSQMPPQIAKLIPRLASEHDGEVVATVRAIERVLRTAGIDWHDLAAAVEVPEPIATAYSYSYADADAYSHPTPQRPQPAPRKPREPGWSDLKRSEQMAWTEAFLKTDLYEKTRALVIDVRDRLHIGQAFYIPPRHKRLLTSLMRAARTAAAAAA